VKQSFADDFSSAAVTFDCKVSGAGTVSVVFNGQQQSAEVGEPAEYDSGVVFGKGEADPDVEEDVQDVSFTFAVTDPALWSAEQPNLYEAEIALLREGALVERTGLKVGLRKFELKDRQMLLNGKRIVFKGVNRHEWSCRTGRTVSREEMTAMANIGLEEGVIDSDENKVIQNIMKLDNVQACDVMTPRIVAMTAQENMTLKNFYKNETYLHFSRIPVYADSPEYITGYILLSDALEGLADDEFDKRLVELKRPISFFKEEDSCGYIWEELLKKHEQIALIIDEYGCFQGIITMEDIIETILGLEIIDENDQAIDMQQFARERWERRQKRFRPIVLPKEDGGNQESVK
jgi:predicted transcriptional regulator